MTTGVFDLIAFDKDGVKLPDYSDYCEGSSEMAFSAARKLFGLYRQVHTVHVRYRKSGLLMATIELQVLND